MSSVYPNITKPIDFLTLEMKTYAITRLGYAKQKHGKFWKHLAAEINHRFLLPSPINGYGLRNSIISFMVSSKLEFQVLTYKES